MRLGDVELLEILGAMGQDARGRIADHWGVTIAAAVGEQRLWIGSQLDDEVATELRAAFESAARGGDPSCEPEAFGVCASILARERGAILRTRSPCFSIPAELEPVNNGVALRRVNDGTHDDLRGLNPGNWDPDEWDDLLDGTLGPWVFAMVGDRVASICHAPRAMVANAAEAGVWTHPDFRGRGYACATTSAWAALVRPSGRHLFYCTDESNDASRAVAARLGLRPIGWTWGLSRPPDPTASHRHPLSPARPR